MKCVICEKDKYLKEFDKDNYRKEGVTPYCSACMINYSNTYPPYIKKLREIYHNILNRCNRPNRKDSKHYFLKGIKCKITFKELLEIWFRDKAFLLERPSIHRKNGLGNYEKENICFIELTENIRIALKRKYH